MRKWRCRRVKWVDWVSNSRVGIQFQVHLTLLPGIELCHCFSKSSGFLMDKWLGSDRLGTDLGIHFALVALCGFIANVFGSETARHWFYFSIEESGKSLSSSQTKDFYREKEVSQLWAFFWLHIFLLHPQVFKINWPLLSCIPFFRLVRTRTFHLAFDLGTVCDT